MTILQESLLRFGKVFETHLKPTENFDVLGPYYVPFKPWVQEYRVRKFISTSYGRNELLAAWIYLKHLQLPEGITAKPYQEELPATSDKICWLIVKVNYLNLALINTLEGYLLQKSLT